MRELLRVQHVFTDRMQGAWLCDMNLSVFRGETLGLVGIHGCGKRCVKQLLSGKVKPSKGQLYIHEKLIENNDFHVLLRAGIQVISGRNALVSSMSIGENMFLLRRNQCSKFCFHAKRAEIETANILKQFGILQDASQRIDQLSEFEQYLFCIAKATSYGAQLIVLDMGDSNFTYQQLRILSGHMQRLKSEGISFLVIGDEPEPLLDAADRIIIMQDGHDVKTLYRDTEKLSDYTYYLSDIAGLVHPQQYEETPKPLPAQENTAFSFEHAEGAHCVFPRGWVVGIFDAVRDANANLENYLNDLISNNHLTLLDKDHKPILPRVGGGKKRKALAERICSIPENSGNMLIPSLSVNDNLAMPLRNRIRLMPGIITLAAKQHVATSFCHTMGMDSLPQRVELLTLLERKLLSIFRWAMTKPKLLLLENPDAGLDLASRARVFQYLRKVSQDGIGVIVASHNMLVLQDDCDVLLLCEDARFVRMATRGESSAIQ